MPAGLAPRLRTARHAWLAAAQLAALASSWCLTSHRRRPCITCRAAVKQALIVASICEFCGAVFMGSGVTETIRDQIADLTYFQQKPVSAWLGGWGCESRDAQAARPALLGARLLPAAPPRPSPLPAACVVHPRERAGHLRLRHAVRHAGLRHLAGAPGGSSGGCSSGDSSSGGSSSGGGSSAARGRPPAAPACGPAPPAPTPSTPPSHPASWPPPTGSCLCPPRTPSWARW